MQAIPASARFLRELRLQFGNLGFVAAAYNAGAHRVAEWLEHRSSLPRETRDYVMRVTGLSVDAWRSMAVNDDALTFVRPLPCRSLPAFASVEQAQSEQAQLEQAKLEQIKLEQAKRDKPDKEAESCHTAGSVTPPSTSMAATIASAAKRAAMRMIGAPAAKGTTARREGR